MSFPGIKILTFEIMSNHLHITLSGSYDTIIAFLEMIKKYLKRYLASKGRPLDLSKWNCDPRSISDLSYLRKSSHITTATVF